MALSEKELQEIIQKLSNELVEAGREMMQQSLTGSPVATKDYQVTISVPAPVGEAIERVTEGMDLAVEQIMSKMASEGLSATLGGAMKAAHLMQGLEGIMSGMKGEAAGSTPFTSGLPELDDKMSQLGELTEQLSKLSEVVNNAADGFGVQSPPEDKKDPS